MAHSARHVHFIVLFIVYIYLFNQLAAQDPGDQVFKNEQIIDFRFHFNQPDYLDLLYQSHEDGEYIPGIVEINGIKYDSVGVRFKGTSSFYGYPGNKKSLRIKFDKYLEYRFDGLKKINLNNGWNDPTMLREKLYLDFLSAQGIPAPRANFARVYIDSTYWGFYTMVEHVDKTFLKDRFGNNDGNLYKAEVAPLTWQGEAQENYYDDFELKTNEKDNDWSGLVSLIDVINNADYFSPEINSVLNVESRLKAWAANNLFVNQDSYLGSASNYYLYQNEADKRFEWIIWDVNLSFGARNGKDSLDIFFMPADRPLTAKLLQSQTYRSEYITAIENLLNAGFDENIFYPKIDALWEIIREDYFQDTLKMYSNEEAEKSLTEDLSNVPGLKPFIKKRRESVLGQILNTHLPELSDPIVNEMTLFQNYPNPFNPATTIAYEISERAHTKIIVFNSLGKKVSELVSTVQNPGYYTILFDLKNLPSGLYFYQLQAGPLKQTKKMLLLQ